MCDTHRQRWQRSTNRPEDLTEEWLSGEQPKNAPWLRYDGANYSGHSILVVCDACGVHVGPVFEMADARHLMHLHRVQHMDRPNETGPARTGFHEMLQKLRAYEKRQGREHPWKSRFSPNGNAA